MQINHLVMWISQCMDIFLSLTHSLSLILYLSLSYCKKTKQTNLFFQLFIWNLYIIIKNSKTECITYSKSKLLVTESQIFFFFFYFLHKVITWYCYWQQLVWLTFNDFSGKSLPLRLCFCKKSKWIHFCTTTVFLIIYFYFLRSLFLNLKIFTR